jgi:hypothetical protein
MVDLKHTMCSFPNPAPEHLYDIIRYIYENEI